MPSVTAPLQLDLVITELEVGGAERCLTRLACGLPSDEFGCRVVALSGPPQGSRQLVDELASRGIPVRFLGGSGIRSTPSVLSGLRRFWKESPPQVVQSFLFHANVLAGLACPADIPMAMGFRVADPRPWRIGLERWVAGRKRMGVCVSQAVARQVAAWGFRDQQLHVIPNGIDAAHFQEVSPAPLASVGIPDDRPVLLVVSRLDPQKGLDWLCEMGAALTSLASHPHVVIVGEGPLRGWLARSLATKGLDQQIHLLGWRPDVPALLKRSEALLLTSRYEGMPNVVLEAMAAGKPVVATQVEGVEELLGSDLHRQAVPFRDSAGFVQRVEAILGSSELRKELSENNLRRVSSRFSLASMIDQYAHLYRSMVGTSRPQHSTD